MKKRDIEELINIATKEREKHLAKFKEVQQKVAGLVSFSLNKATPIDNELTLWKEDEELREVLRQEEADILQKGYVIQEEIKSLFEQSAIHARRLEVTYYVLAGLLDINQEEAKGIEPKDLAQYLLDKVSKRSEEAGTAYPEEGTEWYAINLTDLTNFINEVLGGEKVILPRPNITNTLLLTAAAARNLVAAQSHGETLPITVSPRKSRTQAQIYMNVQALAKTADGVAKLEPFDEGVFNAVCTLYRNGCGRFAIEDLYKAVTGVNRVRDAAELVQAIERSIFKLATTRITIDVSEQDRLYKGRKLESINSAVLDINIVKESVIRPNGEPVKSTVFHVIQEPTLLTYAYKLDHFRLLPNEYMQLPQKMKATKDNISLRYAILQATTYTGEANPKRKTYPVKIKFETLFKNAGIDFSSENKNSADTKRKRTRNNILEILEDLKQKGAIKSYEVYSATNNVRKVEGVLVTVFCNQQKPVEK